MSIKLHYLHNHLDKFPDNLGNYSEEQNHQDLKVMEERYQVQCTKFCRCELSHESVAMGVRLECGGEEGRVAGHCVVLHDNT
ncbi:hypothetical protein EVAR_16829_1 [Eumeta japonica]|uniref:Uncharacterized protein n=1 Tax=Eumeta variegata TaxID=151549 RepID=A0A4C1V303_EUMVA|nr:hypothetical protein EVAR_16829_1 [Eumeta japonica]